MSQSSPFQPGREIARGGMGAILEARDNKLNRTVAMKVMLRAGADPVERQRFLQEARVLGQLAHPNIVPIHDVGVDAQGRLFYVMKLVQGVTLNDLLRKIRGGDAETIARYPLNQLLIIFQKVCDAIGFAHARGVLHRDLKPENIMVGEFGEVLVMDWGLAKFLSDSAAAEAEAAIPADFAPETLAGAERQSTVDLETTPGAADDGLADQATIASDDQPTVAGGTVPMTRRPLIAKPGGDSAALFEPAGASSGSQLTIEGAVMGTPNYMSPEQAAGNIAELDARSDVFSLGGVLYAILVLRPPVEGKSVEAVLKKVISGTIAPPTDFNPAGTLTRRQLEESAADVAAPARSPRQYPLKHCPDGRVPAALSAVAMKALAKERERRYQSATDLEADIQAYQGGFATSAEEAGTVRLIRLFIQRNRVLTMAACVGVMLTAGFMVKVISSERRARENAERAVAERAVAVAAEADAVNQRNRADASAKEARAAEAAVRQALTETKAEKLRADANATEAEKSRQQAVAALGVAREQEMLAKKSADEARASEKRANEANATAQVEKARADTKAMEAQEALKTATAERLRAEAGEREQIRNLFESYLAQGILRAENRDFASARRALEQALATAKPVEQDAVIAATRRSLRDMVAWLTDLSSRDSAATLGGAAAPLKAVAVSPDGHLVAAGGEHGKLYLYDRRSNSPPTVIPAHGDLITCLAFFPDGRTLISASADKEVRVFAVTNSGSRPGLQPLRQWRVGAPVGALALSPDGRLVVSGDDDGDLKVWEPATGRLQATLRRHDGAVSDARFSADGIRFASVSYDRTARVWNVSDAGEFRLHLTTPKTEEQIIALALSANGSLLATAGVDAAIRLWDVRANAAGHRLFGHRNTITALAFHRDDQELISASLDRTLRIWDVASGVGMRVLQGHETGVTDFTRSGDLLFSAGNDQTVRRWPIPAEQRDDAMRILRVAPRVPTATAIAPGNDALAVGFEDGELALYSLPDARQLWSVPGHATNITRIVFAPGGELIASGSFDGQIRFWRDDAGAARLLRVLSNHVDVVNDLAFTPDGRFLATASVGSRMRIVADRVVDNAGQSGGQIALVDVANGGTRTFAAHAGEVLSVAFDANGARLVSAGDDGLAIVWEHRDGDLKELARLNADRDMAYTARFSPDGGRIAAAGRSGALQILDWRSRQPVAELAGHENAILRLVVSPDGGQIITAGADGTLRFWDVALAREVFVLPLPVTRGTSAPLWDFSFNYRPGTGGRMAVPLTNGKIILYRFGDVFGGLTPPQISQR